MAINSRGTDNRIAGRDFHENDVRIENIDARHTINIAIPANASDERPLAKSQRRELNRLIDEIVNIANEKPFVVWQKLHAEIGVDGIDYITVNQYPVAVSFLRAMLDRVKEKDANKALVRILLTNSKDKEIRLKLIHYCNVNYGTGRLNDLTRTQLQMAISWLDQQRFDGKRIPLDDGVNYRLNFNLKNAIKACPLELSVCVVVGFLLGVALF
ncbi:hypothetical protein BT09C10_42040 [Escherichia coli]|nr:hypothetical protein [Escherichia coli O15]